jgi:hypothetical protein
MADMCVQNIHSKWVAAKILVLSKLALFRVSSSHEKNPT